MQFGKIEFYMMKKILIIDLIKKKIKEFFDKPYKISAEDNNSIYFKYD
jgi:hypothetical protein